MLTDTLSLSDLHLLLIEPSDMQQKVIRRSLEELGVHKIDSAHSFAEAWQLMYSAKPDLIVSALYLPDGQADDFLLQLRQDPNWQQQAFMLVSSERNREHLERMKQSGVLAILPKPFAAQDLLRAAKATLDFLHHQELELELFDITQVRVLLVDDSRMARRHIRRVLENMGVEQLLEAENGKEAANLLNEHNFDLVVTDYNMPEMDGRELAELIRQHPNHSHLPILMVSSEANDQHLANISQAGVDAICDKPFEPAEVRQLLQRLLS